MVSLIFIEFMILKNKQKNLTKFKNILKNYQS